MPGPGARETLCATICMMIGTSIYAYIFGNICSILDSMTMRSQLFYSTMDNLNNFMEARNLPDVWPGRYCSHVIGCHNPRSKGYECIARCGGQWDWQILITTSSNAC